jgi:hypothetical protein
MDLVFTIDQRGKIAHFANIIFVLSASMQADMRVTLVTSIGTQI